MQKIQKTKCIEVLVCSEHVGCGKSEVMEVIRLTLQQFYGAEKVVVYEDTSGAIEEAKTTGQTARGEGVVLSLREINLAKHSQFLERR